jgi:hypothetical protein
MAWTSLLPVREGLRIREPAKQVCRPRPARPSVRPDGPAAHEEPRKIDVGHAVFALTPGLCADREDGRKGSSAWLISPGTH